MKPHCPTCHCEPETGWDLTVYPPNELVYGRCETCGEIRWSTEMFSLRSRSKKRAMHCGCCTHPHDLAPGGHHISERGGVS